MPTGTEEGEDLSRRQRLLELLRRHGWNSTSFQLLEPAFHAWFHGGGAVGYVETRSARVAGGPPLADETKLGALAAAFAADARRARRRVVFFGVERRFLRAIGMNELEVGLQAWWDPQGWRERQRSHRSVREQTRRARAKGLTVQRLSTSDLARHRAAIERLTERWQASKAMPPMTFLVELQPFSFPYERRYYGAWRGSRLEGLLVAVPIYQRHGWFFEDILRDPDAPNGTAESLIDSAMVDVAEAGASYVTLGLAPLAGQARWQRLLRRLLSGLYNFEGLLRFRSKLRPDGWDPIYVAWPGDGGPAIPLFDVLDAFAGGKVVRFAIRSIARGPSPVLLLASCAAVPWSMLLASPVARHWFPSPRVQHGWAAFDLAIAAALFKLGRRWHRGTARALLAASLFDVAATTAQALAYNAPRARGWRHWAVMAAAIAAPAALAAIVFGALDTRRG